MFFWFVVFSLIVECPSPSLLETMKSAQSLVDSNGLSPDRPAILSGRCRHPDSSVPSIHPNPSIAHACSSVQLQRSNSCGRFMTASETIQPGQSVIVEDAYVAVMRNAFRPPVLDHHRHTLDQPPMIIDEKLRCEWCFVSLVTRGDALALPSTTNRVLWFVNCPHCPTLYCSPKCRQFGSIEHQFECRLEQFLHRLPEVTRLAIRMCVQAWRQGWNEKDQRHDKKSPSIDQWTASAYDVYSLQTHLERLPPQVLVEYEFQSAICANIMSMLHSNHVGCQSNSIGLCWHESITYTSVLHHLAQTRTNIYAITTLDHTPFSSTSPLSTSAQIRLALSLMPTASLMNHACQPNVSLQYEGRRLTVRAIETIQTGSEILNCYGPMQGHMIKDQRQHVLKEEYFFTCKCQPCTR